MTIRRLVPDDPTLPEVQHLVAAAFPEGSGAPSARRGRDDLNAMVEDGPALVIEVGGVAKACLFSRPSNFRPGALYIGTLVVAPALRGGGKARELIAAMSIEARRGGFTGLVAPSKTPLRISSLSMNSLGFAGFATGQDVSRCTFQVQVDGPQMVVCSTLSGRSRVAPPGSVLQGLTFRFPAGVVLPR